MEAGPQAEPRPGTVEHAEHRMELLNEISKLLAGFDPGGRTVDAVLGLVARTLPLRSAVLIFDVESRRKVVAWPAGAETHEELREARVRAEEVFDYFVSTPVDRLQVDTEVGPQVAPVLVRPAGGQRRYVVLPLVVKHRPVFGVVQFEAEGAVDRADVAFVNAIANQLAITLDREEVWRKEVSLRRRFEGLIDHLDHVFLWEADAETLRITYVSARAEQLLGSSSHGWRTGADGWLAYVVPEDRPLVESALRRAAERQGDQRCDHRCRAQDNRLRWFHTRTHRVELEGGGALLQGVSIDITPTKEAEGRVNEQLQFTRALASSLGEGVVTVDLDGKVTFVNRAAEELLGWSSEDALGRDLEDLLRTATADGRALALPTAGVLRNGRTVTIDEHVFIRADAVEVPVRYTAAPIRRDGRMTGAVLAFQDITARRQAAEAREYLLGASRSLGATLDPAGAFDALAKVVLPRLGDLLFYDAAGPDGTVRRQAAAHIDPEKSAALVLAGRSGETLSPLVQEVVRTGRAVLVPNVDEGWLGSAVDSERQRHLLRLLGVRSVIVAPLLIADRRLGALTFAFAESGRRHAESQLALAEELARRAALALEHARLYESAQQAIRDREHILALVSHDLKNPLGNILIATSMLERKEAQAALAALPRMLKSIREAAVLMKRLIEDLLDFSAIEAGGLKLVRGPHAPAVIVEQAVRDFGLVAEERRVHLSIEVDPGVPMVSCDRDRVLQVLGNLIGNASRIVPAGGAVRVAARPRQHGEVLFAVRDTGPGLTREELDHLFERFRRGTKPNYKGTGLGLSIARGIVLAHGGHIWAENDPSGGAVFYFTLPASA